MYPNWFVGSGADQRFNKYLSVYSGQEVHFLQVGAYTGDASLWLLENILTHPQASLTDVDTWEGSEESIHKTFDWMDVETVYDAKIAPWLPGRVNKIKTTSDGFFSNHSWLYTFVYIDGDHTGFGVVKDGINGWNSLLPGGIIAFDDYLWEPSSSAHDHPKEAVDFIVNTLGDRAEVLEVSGQVWLKKK